MNDSDRNSQDPYFGIFLMYNYQIFKFLRISQRSKPNQKISFEGIFDISLLESELRKILICVMKRRNYSVRGMLRILFQTLGDARYWQPRRIEDSKILFLVCFVSSMEQSRVRGTNFLKRRDRNTLTCSSHNSGCQPEKFFFGVRNSPERRDAVLSLGISSDQLHSFDLSSTLRWSILSLISGVLSNTSRAISNYLFVIVRRNFFRWLRARIPFSYLEKEFHNHFWIPIFVHCYFRI